MADSWYYVQKGQRHGPITIDALQNMIGIKELEENDFIWKKGFDNWKKIKDVQEVEAAPLNSYQELSVEELLSPGLVASREPIASVNIQRPAPVEFSFKKLAEDERQIFVRIGTDRGGAPADYGPFSIEQLRSLFEEKRINGKTLFFVKGMEEWSMLGDHKEFSYLFEAQPPAIKEQDRREAIRKPFVARMFIQNNKKVFEGICRDVSIGGMQVLIDQFPGKAGEKISINVHPENTDYHFVASGTIVRLLEGNNGFSFRFQHLSEEANRAIEKYISSESV